MWLLGFGALMSVDPWLWFEAHRIDATTTIDNTVFSCCIVKMTSDVAGAAEVSQSVLPAHCACRKHRTRTAVHKLGAVNEGQHDAKVQICDRLWG